MEFFVVPGTDEEWHQYWIDTRTDWYTGLGISRDNLRHFEHPKEKLSHYSKRTVDIEYRFGFQGSEWGELEGIANRTDFDLKTHSEHSGKDLSYFDPGDERALRAVRDRARRRPDAFAHGLPRRGVRRGRGAQHQRAAWKSARCCDSTTASRRSRPRCCRCPRPTPCSPSREDLAKELARRWTIDYDETQVHRQALPPSGRDRHAVLHHGRLRDARRPGRHHSRPRHDGARARRALAGQGLPRREARGRVAKHARKRPGSAGPETMVS